MFYNFIRENLTVKTIKDFHKSYGEITWKKIYTLNVDNAHEEILNANNKPFSIFDSRSPVYRSPSDSAIYKLRGSVTNVNAGVTFSKVSYRQSAAHSVNDKRLSDLINDFQTDNFLLIGVSFDDELDIEIEMLKQNVVSNAFYHVAPKLSELQQGRIRRMFPNVVFIDETAESFINKLRSFKSRVEVLPTTFIENVEKIGYNVISKDKYFKAKHQSPNMYKGMQPTWEDIFTNHDVITKRTESIVDTLNNKGNEIKCLVITDKEISGKTTLLYRIGVHFSDDYNVLEFVGDDFDASLTQLNALVIKHHVDKKIMILVDDASWIIDPGMNIINSIQNLNVQLILTLGQKEYNRFFYIFTESNNVKYKIRIESEIRVIDDDDALRFIKKLKSKTYLGSYAGVTTEEAAKKFMQRLKKNDILIALYEFNEGSSFTERIEKLIDRAMVGNDNNLQRFILLLFILEVYGGMELKLSLFYDIFPVTDIVAFRDQISEFVHTDIINQSNPRNVKVKSRYNRLLEMAVMKISATKRSDIVVDILKNLSDRHCHNLKNLTTYHSKVMWHLLKTQNLRKLLAVKDKKTHRELVFRIYEQIHDYYTDFHLYWLHRAISEIKYCMYDDAEIHLNQAIRERGSSSNQIEHTRARLLLDKAISGVKGGHLLFEEGLNILNSQIETEQNDAYTYHTYVIKSCQYYKSWPNIELNNNSIRVMINYYKRVKNTYKLSSVMVRGILNTLFIFLNDINKSDMFPLDQDDLRNLYDDNKKRIDYDALDEY